MLFNPWYGMVGLLILPYYLLFQLGSALVEITGIVALLVGLPLGIISPSVALLFIVVGLGYATLLTLTGSSSRSSPTTDTADAVLGQAGWVASQAEPEPPEAWPVDLPADR